MKISESPQIWQELTCFPALYAAWLRARSGKRQRGSVISFGLELEAELLALQEELRSGRYRHGPYRQFYIYDRKPRLISAAAFRDRVVHHTLMGETEPLLERRFIFDSSACRKGKGVHAAVDRYQGWARRYAYVLKLDVARYFPSIRQADLLELLARRLQSRPVLDLFATVIASYHSDLGPGRGLPIGNLSSQCLANLYLDPLDHYVKETLRVRGYLRYVDDLFLFGDDKARLWACRDAIAEHLGAYGLTLKPSATALYRCRERVPVLGYLISPERRWLRNDSGHRYQRRLRRLAARYRHDESLSLDDVRGSVHAWLGHLRHCEAGGLAAAALGGVSFQRSSSAGQALEGQAAEGLAGAATAR